MTLLLILLLWLLCGTVVFIVIRIQDGMLPITARDYIMTLLLISLLWLLCGTVVFIVIGL